jgi:hypothetical protein
VSISIGRRLGEIYDILPRFVAQDRFHLRPEDVAPKFKGLKLDLCIPLNKITKEDRTLVTKATRQFVNKDIGSGPAIEIRYNFNPNDSARLRKDVEMAQLLASKDLLGIYLIFATISPRDEAIARLKRAGWNFLIGTGATSFLQELLAIDWSTLVEPVAKEITSGMAEIMRTIFLSYAVRETLARYAART